MSPKLSFCAQALAVSKFQWINSQCHKYCCNPQVKLVDQFMSSRNFPVWWSRRVFPGGVWSCWSHTSHHSCAVPLLWDLWHWCRGSGAQACSELSPGGSVCSGLHLPPERCEEKGECCVWDSSGVASWPLALFTAQFLVSPFGFPSIHVLGSMFIQVFPICMLVCVHW